MKTRTTILATLISLLLHPAKARQEEPLFIYDMGEFAITLLSEGQGQGNKSILIGATEQMLTEYIPDDTYPNAINAFLVETPEHTILVDAGFGRKLFTQLEEAGKTPEDIDIILLTHMHGDHIGGLIRDGQKSFSNATLYISQSEHDYWMNNPQASSQQNIINTYKNKLQLFTPGKTNETAQELLPGISTIQAYGHTPGHTAFLLESEGKKLFIWGDITHAMAIQVPHPEVAVTYDHDPQQAIQTRQELYQYLAKNKIRIAGMHIQYPGMGDLTGNQSEGYRFILLCPCEGR